MIFTLNKIYLLLLPLILSNFSPVVHSYMSVPNLFYIIYVRLISGV